MASEAGVLLSQPSGGVSALRGWYVPGALLVAGAVGASPVGRVSSSGDRRPRYRRSQSLTPGTAMTRPSRGDCCTNRPLGHYLDEWLEGRRNAGRTTRSIETYALTVEQVKAHIGGVHPADLTPAQIQRMIDALPRGRARNAKTVMRGAVRAAAMDRSIDTDPMLGVVLEHPNARLEIRVFTAEEFRAFREHLHAWSPRHNVADPVFLKVVDWIAATGCRTGEALGVYGEHVRHMVTPDMAKARVWTVSGTVVESLERGTHFQEHTKGRDSRQIILPQGFMEEMPIYGPLFPSRTGGLRAPSSFRAQWKRRVKGTQWEWVTPKTIRKTVATLFAREVGVSAAQLMLGHTDDAVTRRHYIAKESTLLDFNDELAALRQRRTSE